jgi:hypothetical protein
MPKLHKVRKKAHMGILDKVAIFAMIAAIAQKSKEEQQKGTDRIIKLLFKVYGPTQTAKILENIARSCGVTAIEIRQIETKSDKHAKSRTVHKPEGTRR